MRPRERRETSEQDLFRSRLDQIIDMKHALVKLARAIDWGFLEQAFGVMVAVLVLAFFSAIGLFVDAMGCG
jgi:IS5 family transposase